MDNGLLIDSVIGLLGQMGVEEIEFIMGGVAGLCKIMRETAVLLSLTHPFCVQTALYEELTVGVTITEVPESPPVHV